MGAGRSDAVVWEEVGGVGNAVTADFGDKVEMATVMIFGWSKEPSVKAVQGPGIASFCVFVNDGFCSRWCHGVPIPIIWAFKCFICRDVGVYSVSSE
jgi:hypothetical protein